MPREPRADEPLANRAADAAHCAFNVARYYRATPGERVYTGDRLCRSRNPAQPAASQAHSRRTMLRRRARDQSNMLSFSS